MGPLTITPVSADRYQAEEEAKERKETAALSASTELTLSPESFGEKVADKLGYDTLRKTLRKRSAEASDRDKLLAIMREHDITFYRPADVEHYKMMMESKFEARNLLGIPVAVLGAIAFVALCVYGANSTITGWPLGLSITASWVAIIGGIWHWVYRLDHELRAEWKTSYLRSYTDPVPTSALEKAMKLAEVPSLTFTVDWLSRRVVREPKPVFDPLLNVNLGGATFCIAKWDEPEFTASLTS